jgi:hypothetical protein
MEDACNSLKRALASQPIIQLGDIPVPVFGLMLVHLGRPPDRTGPEKFDQLLGQSGIVNVAGLGRYSLLDHPGGLVLDFKIPRISGMIRSGPSWLDRPSVS